MFTFWLLLLPLVIMCLIVEPIVEISKNNPILVWSHMCLEWHDNDFRWQNYLFFFFFIYYNTLWNVRSLGHVIIAVVETERQIKQSVERKMRKAKLFQNRKCSSIFSPRFRSDLRWISPLIMCIASGVSQNIQLGCSPPSSGAHRSAAVAGYWSY